MSTIKSIFIQHLNGTTPNATMDTNGNFTVGGTVSGASSNMFRNRIINGDMRIDQRNAGTSVTPNNSYTLDRWYGQNSQTGKYTVQQNAGSVTPPAGFTNYLGVTSSSSYSIGSSDYFLIRQSIEGYNVADLAYGTSNAKTVTLSFWVYSSLTGTFGGVIQNDGTPSYYCYPFTYTISSANTWQFITVTVTGPTSGGWQTGNSSGLRVFFSLGAGSSLSGTAGSWVATNYVSATGATSVVGTNGATWYITGVQLEIGTAATPFEFRSYGHELALCQRYCWVNGGVAGQQYAVHGMGYIYASTGATITIFPPVEMRDVPSLSSSGSFRIYDGGSAFAATVPASLNTSNSTRRVFVLEPSASGMTQYRPCNLSSNNDATAKIILSAEL